VRETKSVEGKSPSTRKRLGWCAQQKVELDPEKKQMKIINKKKKALQKKLQRKPD